MIPRVLENILPGELFKGKAIIIYGPRQTGKTTLVRSLVNRVNQPVTWLNGDESDVRSLLENPTSTQLRLVSGNARIVVIDEAQRIKNIGLVIKLWVDNYPDLQVIATGSSSFELANEIKEPLTGRKFEHFLFPFSFMELVDHFGYLEEKRMLRNRLVFGSYPEVINSPGGEQKVLTSLADSYLYKDILVWKNIKKPQALENLIKALALQMGSEVSYHELAQLSGLDSHTVETYIDILEKAFIVFRIKGLYRNKRNELKKSKKVYFYDTGIRNSVISNFNQTGNRKDTGALWENYIITERFKFTHYYEIFMNPYFWRSITRQEIDYIEERGGTMHAVEIKWNPGKKYRFPASFLKNYPDHTTEIITKDHYEHFLSTLPEPPAPTIASPRTGLPGS